MWESGVGQDRNWFVYLDAARFLAAFTVVYGHLKLLLLVPFQDALFHNILTTLLYFWALLAHDCVMVFFVLSGFWISRSVVRRAGSGPFWKNYLIDRLSRLEIVLIPAMALGALFDVSGAFILGSDVYNSLPGLVTDKGGLAGQLSLGSAIGNMLFLQRLVVPTFGTNAALWSLTNEFWYYIWFPALWFILRYRKLTFGAVALVVAAFFPFLLLGFAVWLCGTALYFANDWAVRRGWVGRRGLAAPFLFGGGLAFLGALALSETQRLAVWQSDLLVGFFFAVMAFGLSLWAPRPVRFVTFLASYGARASYSLYLVHIPLIVFLRAIFWSGPLMEPTWTAFAQIFLALAAILVFAWFFAQVTEGNTARLRDFLHRRADLLPKMGVRKVQS